VLHKQERLEMGESTEKREMAMCADERGHNRLTRKIGVRASCWNVAGFCVIADLLDLAIGEDEGDMIARRRSGTVDETHVSENSERSTYVLHCRCGSALGYRSYGKSEGERNCEYPSCWSGHISYDAFELDKVKIH